MKIEFKPERTYAWVNGRKVGELVRENGEYRFHYHAAADKLTAMESVELKAEVEQQIVLLNITQRLRS